MDVERDVTVLVKTFERPDCLRRLVASIRRYYPRIAIVVVDDSGSRCDPVPRRSRRTSTSRTTRSAPPAAATSGCGMWRRAYVLVCDDDMVFERRTDLGRMLHALESTSFDVVSCVWLDFDPWKGICRGPRRFEGTLDVEDGVLVHRLGATRGTVDGLPVFDVVHQFFVAERERLGPDPWDPELNLSEHYELFLTLKERGLRCDASTRRRRPAPAGAALWVPGGARGHAALRRCVAGEAGIERSSCRG